MKFTLVAVFAFSFSVFCAALLKALQRAVQLDPSQPDAHYRLGRVYQAIGNKGEAEKEFAKTRELHQKADAAVMVRMPPQQ